MVCSKISLNFLAQLGIYEALFAEVGQLIAGRLVRQLNFHARHGVKKLRPALHRYVEWHDDPMPCQALFFDTTSIDNQLTSFSYFFSYSSFNFPVSMSEQYLAGNLLFSIGTHSKNESTSFLV